MNGDPDPEIRLTDATGRAPACDDRSSGPPHERYWLRRSGNDAGSAARAETEVREAENAAQAKVRDMKLAFWGTIALVLTGVVVTVVT